MEAIQREIRGLMVTVAGGHLLVPNSNVSEIITAATPEPVAGAPRWLLGRVRWRGWRVPLVSVSLMAGMADRDDAPNAKVAVLKSLGDDPRLPFVAILCMGFPRLTTVTPDNLVSAPLGDATPAGIRTGVMLNDQSAMIPDLPAIEQMVGEALREAA
jgi:chemosensory pili system protein ChpC